MYMIYSIPQISRELLPGMLVQNCCSTAFAPTEQAGDTELTPAQAKEQSEQTMARFPAHCYYELYSQGHRNAVYAELYALCIACTSALAT